MNEVKAAADQSENPLVSIIVITYNSAKYVLETLESAKAQTYQNIELIITDDASQDDTVEICKEWLKENKELFVKTELVTVQKNTGISPNCNRGLKLSNGKWLKFIAGDEVIIPAITWISTSEAVSSVRATPVFVDVEKDHLTIDVLKIEEKVSSKTKAIIPVHLYGHPANMTEVMRIAKKYNLKVLEDCPQAHNAECNGQKVGTIGNAGSFSFYPGKNLGAYGDAGGLITNDKALAKKVKMIANHGQLKKHDHQIEGRNSRMDGMQAAILRAKLPFLNNWNNGRILVAKKYAQAITNPNIVKPKTDAAAKHVFHLYVIRTEKRDVLKALLESKGIGVSIHYPTALPFMPCYRHLNTQEAEFPVAAKYQHQIVSIPMFAELSNEMINTVVEELNAL